MCSIDVPTEPFIVSLEDDLGPQITWSKPDPRTACSPQNNVTVGENTHVFSCDKLRPARHLVAAVRGLGALSICSAFVYGGTGGRV